MSDTCAHPDPLTVVLPEAADRLAWTLVDTATAADTHERVGIFRHAVTGRCLRLDAACRVYGEDAQGVIRLFGRGGAMALAVALNAVYDHAEHLRPARVVLPAPEAPDVQVTAPPAR